MTQKELIIEYIKEHGSILPAKAGGHVFRGVMLGSETSKRCRELRARGILTSKQEGKFERFYMVDLTPSHPTKCCYSMKIFNTHTPDCKSLKEIEVKDRNMLF